MPSADLVGGDYLVRFEARTLDDIRALGGNRRGGRPASLRPLRGCPRSISASIARSCSPGCGAGPMTAWPNGCASCIRCACSTRCSPMPIRSCARCCHPSTMRARTASRSRRTILLASAGAGSRVRSRHRWMPIAICATTCPRRCSTRFMARRWCRPWSGSKPPMQIRARKPGTTPQHLALVAQRIEELKR